MKVYFDVHHSKGMNLTYQTFWPNSETRMGSRVMIVSHSATERQKKQQMRRVTDVEAYNEPFEQKPNPNLS